MSKKKIVGTKLPKTTDELREDAISNIQRDRESAEELLLDLKSKMVQHMQHHEHNQIAGDMVKYLETLLKANAQLIKIVEIETRKKIGNVEEDPIKSLNPEAFYDEVEKDLN